METGDKIKVETHNGNRLCVIDIITDSTVHLKNKKFGIEVNKDRIHKLSKMWRGAKLEYISFN
jgi:hypothetical protein